MVKNMLKISGQIKGILGKGNFWTIKEVETDAPIAIEGKNYKNIACKFSNKKTGGNIGKNLRIYHRIKRAGLPTLQFLKYGLFEHDECLVTENLNNRPNNYIPSINEKYLSDHKIQGLIEFKKILNHVKQIVYAATLGKVGLCSDAFFSE